MKYALTALAMAALASSQASIIIDHFDDPVLGHGATISNPVGGELSTSTAVGLPPANTIGGARTVYVGVSSGGGTSQISVGANMSPSFFTIANDSVTIDGYGGIIWDGGVPGGLNYDLSTCTQIRFDFDNDQDTIYTLTLWTYGGASHDVSVLETAGTIGTAVISLAPFVVAGVDLTDVDWIELKADSEAGGDVAIHLVECDIPEPATTGVAFAALAGLGMVIRRRFHKA